MTDFLIVCLVALGGVMALLVVVALVIWLAVKMSD